MSHSPSEPEVLSVAVLMGGPAAEADVSRSSAAEVAAALIEAGHRARTVELNADSAAALLAERPDVVFPALHGPLGEDGTVQGLLALLDLPFVGSDVRGSALAMDKRIAKLIFATHALPVAGGFSFGPEAEAAAIADRIDAELGTAIVIKPLAEGSAIGVMRLRDRSAHQAAIERALTWPGGALIEPYVDGAEVTVGVLDLEGAAPRTMQPIMIRTDPGEWYDFHNRYAAGKSEHLLPAPLSAPLLQQLESIALSAHRALGLRDLSRSDFLVTENGAITLLETNTLPGMTPTSLYPDGAKDLGYSFTALTDALVRSAWRRGSTTFNRPPDP
ncbi:MAG: D-alanine--D-alanine ligase [Pseudomonadota bacterium]